MHDKLLKIEGVEYLPFMNHSLINFIVGSLIAWAAIAGPAHFWLGGPTLVFTLVALTLCLIPTCITMIWANRALRQSRSRQLVAILGGGGLRMLTVLSGGLVLSLTMSYFRQDSFWIWLIVFYLLMLALEVPVLLSAIQPIDDASSPMSSVESPSGGLEVPQSGRTVTS